MTRRDPSFVVVGLGEILWDLLPTGKQLGGAPANFAYHAHALGAESYVVSAIGKDALGQEIIDHLQRLNLDTQYIAVDPRRPTGTVEVKLDTEGKPQFIIHQDVAWDFIPCEDKTLQLASRANAVCFGSLCQRSLPSRNAIRRFLEATANDCLRVFDINLRQTYYDEETIRASLAFANVVKLNDEELPIVAKLLSIEGAESDCLGQLIDHYQLHLIVLTRGEKGSLLRMPNQTSIHDGLPAEIADTVGAGDAFTAATVMGLLRGRHLDWINTFANTIAGYVCSQNGATPAIPASLREEINDRMS